MGQTALVKWAVSLMRGVLPVWYGYVIKSPEPIGSHNGGGTPGTGRVMAKPA